MSADFIVQLTCDADGCSNRLTVPVRSVGHARLEAAKQRDWKYTKRQDLCRVHARQSVPVSASADGVELNSDNGTQQLEQQDDDDD